MKLTILDLSHEFIELIEKSNEIANIKSYIENLKINKTISQRIHLLGCKLILWYNLHYRVKSIQKQLKSVNRSNISLVCKSPSKLPDISYEYIEFLIETSKKYKTPIDFIIYKTLKQLDLFMNVTFNRSTTEPDLVDSYTIIIQSSMKYFTTNHINKKYENKWMTIKFNRSLQTFKDNIEFSILDCENKDALFSSNPIYTKYFELVNGSIYNPNYSISEELKNEDYSLYTAIASTIIFIFSIVIENTMNIEVTKK